ncbi:MAG TPA: PspA/IM30 family protein [Polyangiaceae bacterium]|nr:PspA/IM30 family protein [Polyangiaceae bacterium]
MGIFDRMGKVIQSNLNALLDKAEDERKLVDLNLDEMDDQIKSGHQEVVQAVAAEKQLRKKCDDLQADVARWDKRAELALKSGDEALAREALKQKKLRSAELDMADKVRTEQRDVAVRMRDDLERMKQKVAELKLRKPTIVARAQQARATASGSEQLGARGGTSAFENFRRMEEKIEGREAEGAAMAEVDDALGKREKGEDLEAKFRDLERHVGGGAGSASDVDDDLAALKKRIRV